MGKNTLQPNLTGKRNIVFLQHRFFFFGICLLFIKCLCKENTGIRGLRWFGLSFNLPILFRILGRSGTSRTTRTPGE